MKDRRDFMKNLLLGSGAVVFSPAMLVREVPTITFDDDHFEIGLLDEWAVELEFEGYRRIRMERGLEAWDLTRSGYVYSQELAFDEYKGKKRIDVHGFGIYDQAGNMLLKGDLSRPVAMTDGVQLMFNKGALIIDFV